MNARRSAYTLLELVLATAVIVMTAAIAVPSLDGMYPSYKLNAAIDSIRAAWALGRAHAIEEGRPYRFAVAPGSDNYQLSPDEAAADGGEPADADPMAPPAFRLNEQLPKGVTFALAREDTDTQSPNSTSSSTSTPSSSSTDGLSTVAVFLPDGTARDDAEIRFQIKGALPKSIKLRALTGAVTTIQQHDEGGTR